MVPGYLDATMEAFNRNQDQMRAAFSTGSPFTNFESIARTNMELFEQSMRAFTPFGTGGERAAGAAESEKKNAEPQA